MELSKSGWDDGGGTENVPVMSVDTSAEVSRPSEPG